MLAEKVNKLGHHTAHQNHYSKPQATRAHALFKNSAQQKEIIREKLQRCRMKRTLNTYVYIYIHTPVHKLTLHSKWAESRNQYNSSWKAKAIMDPTKKTAMPTRNERCNWRTAYNREAWQKNSNFTHLSIIFIIWYSTHVTETI